MERKTRFIITKKIAKHGKQAIIVIPKVLEMDLKPGTLAEIYINIIEDNSRDKADNKENLEGKK